MVCGTVGRPCPKLTGEDDPRITEISHFRLPPPCLYLLPATVPSPRNNPNPPAQSLSDVEILQSFASCFKVRDEELNYVTFNVEHKGADTVRSTTITRNGAEQRKSNMTAIRRS